VLYDNGKFLYSHHATDPCSGRLVNAFDLVRLHKFGDQDDTAQAGIPTNRLPSYTAMCEYACGLADVAALISKERYDSAVKDFGGVVADAEADTDNWMALTRKKHADRRRKKHDRQCADDTGALTRCLRVNLRSMSLQAAEK